MGILSVVTGGQYGSEAKGAVTARIARQSLGAGTRVVAVRVAGPNAGHTAYDDAGNKWALRQIPAAAVDPRVLLVIGAGSEIEYDVVKSEIDALEEAGIPITDRLYIDPQATVLTEAHHAAETGMHERMGSTGKGIGAARADRIMRTAQLVGDQEDRFSALGTLTDTSELLYTELRLPSTHVLIEGTQGYGLGLHAGHYPQCTSSDTRAIDFLAMAGVDPHHADAYEVFVVLRRYPIRVAGNSGPLQGETTWADLGLPEERTTVTHKVRRVGEWDADLARRAVIANGGPDVVRIALTMADQAITGLTGADGPLLTAIRGLDTADISELASLIDRVESDCGAPVMLIGTSPTTMIER